LPRNPGPRRKRGTDPHSKFAGLGAVRPAFEVTRYFPPIVVWSRRSKVTLGPAGGETESERVRGQQTSRGIKRGPVDLSRRPAARTRGRAKAGKSDESPTAADARRCGERCWWRTSRCGHESDGRPVRLRAGVPRCQEAVVDDVSARSRGTRARGVCGEVAIAIHATPAGPTGATLSRPREREVPAVAGLVGGRERRGSNPRPAARRAPLCCG
jgi:hypothetical protein